MFLVIGLKQLLNHRPRKHIAEQRRQVADGTVDRARTLQSFPRLGR